jgi:zinc transporter ZupT
MDSDTWKIPILVSLLILAIIGGFIPLKLSSYDPEGIRFARNYGIISRIFSLGNMLSGGIFLGGGLIHLLPEGVEALAEITENAESAILRNFPHGYFLCALGFLVIILIEEITVMIVRKKNENKENCISVESYSEIRDEIDNEPNGVKFLERTFKHENEKSITSYVQLNSESNPFETPEFLRLYFQRRSTAHSIIKSLHPISSLECIPSPRTFKKEKEKENVINIENDSDSENVHSHDIPMNSAVAYILVLSLSAHSIFEGIAFGTQNDFSLSIMTAIAIAAHTPLAGFALGVSMVKSEMTTCMFALCIITFSLTVPLGGVMGIILSFWLQGPVLLGVAGGFQSFSAGTFLYVVMEEIIPKELALPQDKLLKMLLCLVGFLVMAAVKLLDVD